MKTTNETKENMTTYQTTTEVAVRADALKAKRKLTLDATSITRLGQVVCRIDGELETIEMPPQTKGGPVSHAAAVPIFDLVRTESYLLICNSLIVSALQRAGAPLTGRYFAMRAGEIKAGKRYRSVEVIELEAAQ